MITTEGTPEEHARAKAIGEAWQAGFAEGRRAAVERMQAMRRDYRTMPHAEFPLKWPDWKEYDEVLPTNCSCGECRLWRSGS